VWWSRLHCISADQASVDRQSLAAHRLDLVQPFSNGLHNLNDRMWLYVSAGTGDWVCHRKLHRSDYDMHKRLIDFLTGTSLRSFTHPTAERMFLKS
jgi:hypothetical protein